MGDSFAERPENNERKSSYTQADLAAKLVYPKPPWPWEKGTCMYTPDSGRLHADSGFI